jgi:hypothetical protein
MTRTMITSLGLVTMVTMMTTWKVLAAAVAAAVTAVEVVEVTARRKTLPTATRGGAMHRATTNSITWFRARRETLTLAPVQILAARHRPEGGNPQRFRRVRSRQADHLLAVVTRAVMGRVGQVGAGVGAKDEKPGIPHGTKRRTPRRKSYFLWRSGRVRRTSSPPVTGFVRSPAATGQLWAAATGAMCTVVL